MKHCLCTVFLIAALAGCSRIQLVYNQLDWLIPYYVETYVDLSDDQHSYLGQQVETLLAWHCSTQLGAYADLLRAASADFRDGRMTPERLVDYSKQIEKFWKELLMQASPTIVSLLLEADDAQLRELFESFEERDREWLAGYHDTTPEELRDDYIQRMENELERWFGPLQTEQQEAVLQWAEDFRPLGMEGLEMRKAWQARLRELVRHRDQRESFSAGIHELLGSPETLRTAAYQQRLDSNRRQTIELVYSIGSRLDPEQRLHLDHHAESVARDFDTLTCTVNVPGAVASDAPGDPSYQ